MEAAARPSWFSLTPEQDETICCWHQDFSKSPHRLARISLTRSSNDDGRSVDPKVTSWVQLKLFKNTPPSLPSPDGYFSPTLGQRKNQQVSLRPIEAEKVLFGSNGFREGI